MASSSALASSLVSDGLIAKLDPSAVEHYAEVTGWKRVPGLPSEIALFHRSSLDAPGDLQEILVPRDRTFIDFAERLAEAVESLSVFEGRSLLEMFNSVLAPSDILRFRVVSPNTVNGVLPFLEGVDLYNGMKRTLMAAACDLLKPQAYHPRLVRREAEQYLEACSLGQTMVGSYVATVICPIDSPLSKGKGTPSASLFPELSQSQFNRNVTSRVMQSLQTIRTRLDQGDAELLVHPVGGDFRISGNFFEALTEMQSDQAPSRLDVSVLWSPTSAPSQNVPSEVEMPEEYFPQIALISDQLRPDFQPQRRQILGKVIALYSEQNEEDLMEGEVIIRFVDEDNLADARLPLRPKDYELACDAHKLGRYVEVFGTLERLKRRYVITSYQLFDVLPLTTFGTDIKKKYALRAQTTLKRRRGK